jgi:hypothetical protein
MIGASIVEWGKLLEAAYMSAAFAIVVLLLGGLAVVASLHSQDRDGANRGGVIALNLVAGGSALAIAGAVALGMFTSSVANQRSAIVADDISVSSAVA